MSLRRLILRVWVSLGRKRLKLKTLLIFGKPVIAYGDFQVGNAGNIVVGSNLAINAGVFLLGHESIVIGDDVILSAGAMLIDGGLDPASFGGVEVPKYRPGGIVIGDGVWIGAGAIVLPGVTIGRRAIVGAGAVVTRDVAEGDCVVGMPARVR